MALNSAVWKEMPRMLVVSFTAVHRARGRWSARLPLAPSMTVHRIPYAATHRFSKLVVDQVGDDPFLNDFQQFPSSLAGLQQAASQRAFPAAHRTVLVNALRRQYAGMDISGPVQENMGRLAQPDALSVTTGHQLCILTGPLYVPFKLLNAIRLARTLTQTLGRPVVPVFWMATEDHDRAEIDHASLSGHAVRWPGEAAGAVGRMQLHGFGPVLDQVDALLGSGADADALRAELRRCYRPEYTLAEATRRFVHALFGRFGLLIVDGDDRELKRLFVPVMKEELLHSIAQRSVAYADERLHERYPAQAHARPINLFHLRPGHRARIDADDRGYQVLDGGPRFTAEELLLDVELRPQDYSPNVLLRPVYQETVLPNIAYIGGGGELAYWMQLRWLFQGVRVPMPVVVLRTSAAFLPPKQDRQREAMGLSVEDLFRPAHELADLVAQRAAGTDNDLVAEQEALAALFAGLRQRAAWVDPSLAASADAAAVRAQRMLHNLKDKMDRALRRREQVHVQRMRTVLEALFPGGGLQERTENILPMIAAEGPLVLDRLLEQLDPLDRRFSVLS